MRKKIMKCLALLLSAALVLGSVNYTTSHVQAGDGEEGRAVSGGDVSGNDVSGGNGGNSENEGGTTAVATSRYYTFKDVTNAGGYGYTESISDAGVLTAGFTGQYQEVRYSLPSGVDATTLKNITLDITSDNVSSLAIKILVDGTQKQVVYGTNSIDVTADLSEGTITFAVMNKAEGALEGVVIENIKITAVQTGGLETKPSTGGTEGGNDGDEGGNGGSEGGNGSEGGTTEEATSRYYTFKDVTNAGGYGYTESISDAGVLTAGFTGQYQEVRYSLPSGVDATTLKNITLDITSDNVSSLAIKILVDGTQKQVVYETNSIDVTADLSEGTITFAVMNKAEGALEGVVIENIKITAVQTGGSETKPSTEGTEGGNDGDEGGNGGSEGGNGSEGGDEGGTIEEATGRYYTFKDVTKASGGWGNTPSVDETTGVLSISYSGQYAEVKYSLPAGVDAKTLESIVLDVTEGEATGLALKIYIDDTEKMVKYNTATIVLDEATKTLLQTAESVALGIMNNASGAAEYVIANIKITAVQTGGLETKPSTGGTEGGNDGDEGGNNGNEGGTTEEATGRYYTFKDVTKASGGWGNTPSVDETTGVLSISYSGQYAEVKYSLPAGVDAKTLESIVLDVTEGEATGLALKIYIDDTEKMVKYNTATIVLDEATKTLLQTAESVALGIMNMASEAADYVIANIKITAVQTGGLETKPSTGENEGGNGEGEGGNDGDENESGSTTNVTPAAQGEEDKRFTYKEGELTYAYSNSGVTYEAKETEKVAVTLPSSWNEIRFTLPENIDLAKCNSVTFAVSKQSVPLCFKLYDTDGNEISDITQYSKNGTTKVTITGRNEIVSQVAIMIHSNDVADSNTCVFDGVLFDMIKEEEVVETYEKTFKASELVKDWANATTCELTDAGWTVTFAELNLEARFKLPESLNMENCQSINIKVSSQTGPVNFHLAADGTKLKNFWYNVDKTSYTLVPDITSKISEILVQCGGEKYTEGSAITIESVTFVMIGKEPLPTPKDDDYAAVYFEVEEVSAGVVVTEAAAADEAMEIEFPKEGDSVILAIPDSVDVNHLVSVDVSVLEAVSAYSMRSAAAAPVTVSLLDANKKVLVSSVDGSLKTNCNPDVKYIKLTANQDDVAVYLTNVKFNIDENAFEAIVLNGNFAREDVSMWGAAVYGSVDGVDTAITTHTSTTPIFGDVYTYGEISRRSSPYVCFAQNVTSRVTPGKTYSFSFYAKLSEDYADAPANQREITFSPYYLDANGTEQYGLVPDGVYKMSLKVNEWTYFSGTVTVPADSTGFVIRIVEQGTNYGQGDCVKGSYAVTGVVLEEYDASKVQSTSGSTFNPAAQPIGYTVTYTAEDLVASTVAAETEKTEDGKIKVLFGQQYGEVKLKLPRSLDMSKVCYITVKVSNQLNPIAVKLYKKGTQEWVSYFNNFSSEYQVVPYMSEEIDTVGIMSLQHYGTGLDGITIESITFNLTEEPAPIPVSKDIVANGYFDGDDIDDWKAAFWGDGVTMTQMVSATAIFDSVYTYGAYSKRTSPYQCFAQDITDKVEQNEKYTFTFWARLSDDYKGAPENMRVVQFAPYTVDKDGNPDYNPKLEGTYSQVLEPGVWTKFEGTYKVTNANEIGQVIIRILEQGTNYGQGDCVMGAYDVTGVVIEKYVPEPPSIDEDVPALKDAVTEVFGEDFIVGTALSGDEYDDIGVDMLVNKHFNAVTIGNELKPDALFGYSNSQHTKLQTIEFNGQELVVPTLDYSRAEAILNQILKWNEEHPDDPIKVRGHVLVWHSQTPEWFFRENYVVGQNADGTENYVTPEEMSLRLEWYIKTVLEHFTGEDSKYKGLFYGWDVVNEAVGDGGNGYRTDKVSATESPSADTHSKNSSWWAVYQSNEFIIKAFQYANKYAPAEVELYYNDYNDADTKKVTGIVALLKDVLAAEGTRIDAMGMQGHYNLFNPSNKSIERAIRAYAEVVGAVQYTEFDFKASGNISSEKGLQDEYKAQAERYHDIYLLLQKLNAEEGISITGFTVWGVIDSHSWLQSASDVGGGAEVEMDQCPLLFDSNYKVKPSYWAFVDYSKVDPDWVPEETTADETNKKDNTEDKNTDEEADKDTQKEEDNGTSTDSSKENGDESQVSDESVVSDVEVVKKTSVMPIVAVVVVVAAAAAATVGVVMAKRKKK